MTAPSSLWATKNIKFYHEEHVLQGDLDRFYEYKNYLLVFIYEGEKSL